jgi:hypothetical protein
MFIIAVVIAIIHALSRPVSDEFKTMTKDQKKAKISHGDGIIEASMDVNDEATIVFSNQDQCSSSRNRFKSINHNRRPVSAVTVTAAMSGDGPLLVVPIGLESEQRHFSGF